MKKLILLAYIIVNYCSAQPQITWEKKYGNIGINISGFDIVQLSDSSYTVLGSQGSSNILMHLNYLGDTIWTKFYTVFLGGNLVNTYDGGYAMLGSLAGCNTLIKTNYLGDTIWTNSYQNTQNPNDFIQTIDSGFLLSAGNGIGLTKTDSLGNIVWQNALNFHVRGVIECNKKEVLAFGSSGFNPQCYSATLLDSNGLIIWNRNYGNVTYLGADPESILSAIQLPDSNFIVGCSTDLAQNGQYHLLKLNHFNGDTIFSNRYYDAVQYSGTNIVKFGTSSLLISIFDKLKKINYNSNTIWTITSPFPIANFKECTDSGIVFTGFNPSCSY